MYDIYIEHICIQEMFFLFTFFNRKIKSSSIAIHYSLNTNKVVNKVTLSKKMAFCEKRVQYIFF